jgi:hypothetical protein
MKSSRFFLCHNSAEHESFIPCCKRGWNLFHFVSFGLFRRKIDEFPRKRMAGVAGLEPVTSAVTGQRSNQLSYTPNRWGGEL